MTLHPHDRFRDASAVPHWSPDLRLARGERTATDPVASAATMDLCGRLLKLSSWLHQAGPDPRERKRRLLTGLCDLVGAARAAIVVTRTDLSTGRQEVLSSLSVRTVTQPAPAAGEKTAGKQSRRDRRLRSGTANAVSSPRRRGFEPGVGVAAAVVHSKDGEANESDLCLDDYAWLDGLKLAGCVALYRPAGSRRFSAQDRAIVDLVHQRFPWVYAHDWHLAALAADDPQGAGLLRDLIGEDADPAIDDRRGTARRLRPAVAQALSRVGVTSRDELIAWWSEWPGPAHAILDRPR